jgi:SET domain-containing protein
MEKQSTTRSRTARRNTPLASRSTRLTGINARYPWKEEPNPYFELRPSPIQGTGVFATRDIRKGTRIVEYLGERISWRTADKRYDDGKMGRHHTFLFTVDEKTCIDGAVKGNDARFINHSCDGNCETINDRKRIFVEARRNIARGEELTYDYAYERTPEHTPEDEALYVCRCGAATCRGSILVSTVSSA